MKVCDELLESKPGVGTLDVCTTMAMAAKCMHNSSPVPHVEGISDD